MTKPTKTGKVAGKPLPDLGHKNEPKVEFQPKPTHYLFLDLEGQTFKYWTVIGYAGRRSNRHTWWCRCVCGAVEAIRNSSLTTGNSTSCGCRRDELAGVRATTHGHYGTPEYRAWMSMKSRCLNPKNKRWSVYGGRGITIDKRWLGPDGFANFLADMKELPEGTTLDRKDSDGNYTRSNCRWLPAEEQSAYRRWCVTPEERKRRRRIRLRLRRALLTGEIVKPAHCEYPGCPESKVNGYHHKGFAEELALDVAWRCSAHCIWPHRRVTDL